MAAASERAIHARGRYDLGSGANFGGAEQAIAVCGGCHRGTGQGIAAGPLSRLSFQAGKAAWNPTRTASSGGRHRCFAALRPNLLESSGWVR